MLWERVSGPSSHSSAPVGDLRKLQKPVEFLKTPSREALLPPPLDEGIFLPSSQGVMLGFSPQGGVSLSTGGYRQCPHRQAAL